MSKRKSEFYVDNKIQSIREDLQKLTSDYRATNAREQSPIEQFLESKYLDPTFKLSKVTESHFPGSKDSQDTAAGNYHRENQLKVSQSVSDLRKHKGPSLESAQNSKPYTQNYDEMETYNKNPMRTSEIIDPTVSTAYRGKSGFATDRNKADFYNERNIKDPSLKKVKRTLENKENYISPISDLAASARGLEDKANELETAKNALFQENLILHKKLASLEKEIKNFEPESSMQNEIKLLKANNHELEKQLTILKKEKIGFLKEIDQKSSELRSAIIKIKELEEKIQELSKLLPTRIKHKSLNSDWKENTKGSLKEYKNENNKLKTALRRKPSCAELRRANQKIEKLEIAIEDIRTKKRRSESAKRLREKSPKLPRIRPRSENRERKHELSPSKNLDSQKCTEIIRELMNEFSVNSPSSLLSNAKLLLHDTKAQSQQRKLVERLKKLIMDYSPPEIYEKNPSLKTIWKWIRRLTEEYIQLKKKNNQNISEKEILSKLKKTLCIENTDEIPRSLTKLLADNENYMVILNKVKAALKLNTRISIQELEKEIEKRI
ncbi:unnamed protein product [Blepharisma stoltei]|uniref:Uncharacterized protein n=1 Tax=Blepharisma stoltei TaxID=1481888 RepID=A0AAU9IWD1_9CILI|nr:unnamed protein product [Blepharisma stoltei]